MIKFENTVTPSPEQWRSVIMGARNPLNSWDRSDSCFHIDQRYYLLGENDFDLMMRLRNAGTDHRKFMRMLVVYVDITAPLYWWKEFDTYKVGTVVNSCSTMHKIADKEFGLEDFSLEHLETIARFYNEDTEHEYPYHPYVIMKRVIYCLNACRETYLRTKNKTDWWQMIQLLPSSYNQKRTVMLNYEVLANIYKSRKDHKLDEWSVGFISWIESLPYSELIVGEGDVIFK